MNEIRPGMVRAVRADGTVGWVDLHEMIDVNITQQIFSAQGQERMRIDNEGGLRIGVFGCEGDADDPAPAVEEQPSIPLEEMEAKVWGDTPCPIQSMKEAVDSYIDMLRLQGGTIPWIKATVEKRGPQELDVGFFYCPYIPKLELAPIPKKRKVLSSR